jgi:hypothetical protein
MNRRAFSAGTRVWRTTELRVGRIEIDSAAERYIDEALADSGQDGIVRIIANDPDAGDSAEYEAKRPAKIISLPLKRQ